MSEPLIDPADLGVYLKDTTIDEDRAEMMIADAQALCESIVSPLPVAAIPVLRRVAARAYVTTTSARSRQIADAGSPFGGSPGGVGGVLLTRADVADLRRLTGSGGAFNIDLLPADYQAPAPWYGDFLGDFDSPVGL